GIREVFTGDLWVSAFAEYAATMFFVFVVSGASLRWEGTPSSVKISLAAGLAMASVTQAFRWITITGVGLIRVLSPEYARGMLGSTLPASGTSWPQTLGTEAILTFFLVITILATLDAVNYDFHARYDVSAAVGLVTVTCYLIGVPLTGAGLNPARSLGPAILSNTWDSHWVYWCGPLGGASVAGVLYNMLLHSRSAWNKYDTPTDSDESSLKP
ncbi:hypothetical protein QZH41_019825, partial [Actinostola sp. cb2023]